jgi:hypothetical protein
LYTYGESRRHDQRSSFVASDLRALARHHSVENES